MNRAITMPWRLCAGRHGHSSVQPARALVSIRAVSEPVVFRRSYEV
jgi:hypothetical protein